MSAFSLELTYKNLLAKNRIWKSAWPRSDGVLRLSSHASYRCSVAPATPTPANHGLKAREMSDNLYLDGYYSSLRQAST